MDLLDALFAESVAFEAHCIDSVSMSAALGSGFRERKNVASDRRTATDECMRAYAHEVVHRTQRAHRSPILDDDMATQGRTVGHDYMIANRAIVGYVSVGHNQIVAADFRQASPFCGATVNRDEFANDIVVANLEPRGLTFVTQVLRRESNGRKWKEAIARACFGRPFYGDVRDQFATFAQFDTGSDSAVRADLARGMNFRGVVENGSGMETHRSDRHG